MTSNEEERETGINKINKNQKAVSIVQTRVNLTRKDDNTQSA